jgi:hypothetical protein
MVHRHSTSYFVRGHGLMSHHRQWSIVYRPHCGLSSVVRGLHKIIVNGPSSMVYGLPQNYLTTIPCSLNAFLSTGTGISPKWKMLAAKAASASAF